MSDKDKTPDPDHAARPVKGGKDPGIGDEASGRGYARDDAQDRKPRDWEKTDANEK